MLYFVAVFPIVLSIISAVICSKQFSTSRRKADRLGMIGAVFVSILMIILQLSWVILHIREGDFEVTIAEQYGWYIFEILVLLIFVNFGVRRGPG